jgi:hypothetical protein
MVIQLMRELVDELIGALDTTENIQSITASLAQPAVWSGC